MHGKLQVVEASPQNSETLCRMESVGRAAGKALVTDDSFSTRLERYLMKLLPDHRGFNALHGAAP